MKCWNDRIAFFQNKLSSLAENVEETLFEETMHESLSDEEQQQLSSVVEESIASNNKEMCHIPPMLVKPAVSVPLPRPALRFVRDITYPDGIIIAPGTVFSKIWRVRNDGQEDWPEGVCLCNAGGDILSDPEAQDPLPALPAGEEVDVSVQLRAPECCGRFISYFKAQTSEGDKFGQRLWCNVVVSDEGDDWNMVSGTTDNDLMMAASAADAMLEAELAEIALTEMTEEKDTDVILEEACREFAEERKESGQKHSVSSSYTSTVPLAACTIPSSLSELYRDYDALQSKATGVAAPPGDGSMLELLRNMSGGNSVMFDATSSLAAAAPASHATSSASTFTSTPTSTPYEENSNFFPEDDLSYGAVIWSKELQLLSEMGFVDHATIIPLLEQFCPPPMGSSSWSSSPSSYSSTGGEFSTGRNQAEGLQAVVANLLQSIAK